MYKQVILLIIVALLVAACGGDDLSTDDAQNAIKAGLEGNFDEANKYLCEADQIKAEDVENMPEGLEVSNVACDKDGDNMKCSVTMKMVIEEGQDPVEQQLDLTIPVVDGKLCGGDLSPSGGE